jgi:hypothetical protein
VDESNKDYLGVRDFRLIHTLLQVIISWGFYPSFLPGVGVPLSKRVKSGYTNHGKRFLWPDFIWHDSDRQFYFYF